MNSTCLDASSPCSSPSSSPPGSPVIGSSDGRRQEKAANQGRRLPREDEQAVLACPGRALLRGGPVKQPLTGETAGSSACLPLYESQELEYLLLSMAQASYALELECAAVASSADRNERREFYGLRQNATKKMRALITYVDQRAALAGERWRHEAEVGIHRLHRRIGYLAKSGPADELCHDPALASRAHQLFHLQLELRLLSVSALAHLSALSEGPPPRDSPAGPVVPWLTAAPPRHRWRRAAHALAWELAALARVRMKETPLAELPDTSAFSCGCEKGAWLALRRLLQPDGGTPAGAGPGGASGLWAELEPMFGYILNPPLPPPDDEPADEFPLLETEWTDAPLFLAWLMSSISDVFRYNSQDVYQPDLTCDRNTSQLLALVSASTAGSRTTDDEPAGTEARLSCLLALCGRITELWGPTPALTNALWEMAVRRLVRPRPPGPISVVQMTNALPRSGRRWFESIIEPPPAEDSFSQYLLQLPAQLSGAAGAECWRQLRSRVLLRLHAKRAAQLAAPALRAACSLFLTLLRTVTDDAQLVEKYMAFLSQVSEASTHELLVCRAYFAAMHLLLESGRDLGAVAAAAATQADRELRAAADGRTFSPPLVAAYWDECSELVRASPRIDKSEYQLVTSGWRAYLGWCGPSELARGLSVLLQLAGKLLGNIRQLQPLAHVVDSEVMSRKEQYSLLADRLRLVSPALHSLAMSAGAPQELAQLGATLTLVPNAGCELHHFTADTVTPSVCAGYVTELLSAAPERLSTGHDRLTRLWLRCWAGGADLPELGAMTAAVARREALVPPGPPADPRTAREFAERLARLAEQSKEGRERVNAIFSDLGFIDAYLRGPRAGTPGLTHLFLVFGLVVKHLINVLELRMVVSIIQRLLLPPAVYNADRALSPPMRNALARAIPLFLTGIARSDYMTEKSYRRFIKDTLVHYMYRFPSDSHPLLDVFRSDEAPVPFKEFVMQMMAETFLQKVGGKFHNSLLQASQCLSALVSADDPGGHHTALVARWTSTPLLELLLTLDELNAKRAATDLLKLLCRSPAADVRSELRAALERLLERHLAFSSGRVFQLLEVVAVLAPRLTGEMMTTLERHVRRTEIRRGVGEDRILRNGMSRVQRRIAAAGVAVSTPADPAAKAEPGY